jgi:hypothetical protein
MTDKVGTIYRLYSEDRSTHYTAVLLKNGSLLEVKNPEGASNVTAKTLEEWKLLRGDVYNILEVDTSKADRIVVGEDTNGFNYPQKREDISAWFQWCYEIMKEGAPHLLEKEEVKNAYNALYEACYKYKNELHTYKCSNYTLSNRYDLNNINKVNMKEHFRGLPWYFFTYYQYNNTDRTKILEEIAVLYNDLYELISKDVVEFLNSKKSYATSMKEFKETKKQIGYVNRRIKRYEDKVNDNKKILEGYMQRMKELDEELCK